MSNSKSVSPPVSSIVSTARPASVNRSAMVRGSRSVATISLSQLVLMRMSAECSRQVAGTYAGLRSELLEEAKVVREEQANVVEIELARGEPIDAKSEGESREALRVDADRSKYVRMHHSRAAHLDPA